MLEMIFLKNASHIKDLSEWADANNINEGDLPRDRDKLESLVFCNLDNTGKRWRHSQGVYRLNTSLFTSAHDSIQIDVCSICPWSSLLVSQQAS